MMHIAAIVGEHGDCEAVPILIRRIAQSLAVALTVLVHSSA
jgi:hypothetical protein